MGFSPKHTKADRDMINFNGLVIPNLGVFIASGSVINISGSMTGSNSFHFEAVTVRLRRVEVFQSSSSTLFNIRLENSSPNTASFFDPRNIIASYNDIPGDINY